MTIVGARSLSGRLSLQQLLLLLLLPFAAGWARWILNSVAFEMFANTDALKWWLCFSTEFCVTAYNYSRYLPNCRWVVVRLYVHVSMHLPTYKYVYMCATLRWYLCTKVYDIKGEFCKILVELENNTMGQKVTMCRYEWKHVDTFPPVLY